MEARMSTRQASRAAVPPAGKSRSRCGKQGRLGGSRTAVPGRLLEEESEGGSRQRHGEGGQAPSREDVTRIVDPEVAAGESHREPQEENGHPQACGKGQGQGKREGEAGGGMSRREAEAVRRMDEGKHPYGQRRAPSGKGPFQDLDQKVGESEGEGRRSSRPLDSRAPAKSQEDTQDDRHGWISQPRQRPDQDVQGRPTSEHHGVQKPFVEFPQSEDPARHVFFSTRVRESPSRSHWFSLRSNLVGPCIHPEYGIVTAKFQLRLRMPPRSRREDVPGGSGGGPRQEAEEPWRTSL
jgi:hypothetical protein